MEHVTAELPSPLLKLPLEAFINVMARLPPYLILRLSWCGSTSLNVRMKHGGATVWNDIAPQVYACRIEFASTLRLTSVTLKLPVCPGPLLSHYVRSLPPTLRYLSVSAGMMGENFFNDDGSTLNDALIPSHAYECCNNPWIVRKSFPILETLRVKGSYSESDFHVPTFVAQHLAGLPSTLTELVAPYLIKCVVDVFQLLPPNITKLGLIGGRGSSCYPTSPHSLDYLAHLKLYINEDTTVDRGIGHWEPTVHLSKLAFPPFLTFLKLSMERFPLATTLPPFPETLHTFILAIDGRAFVPHPYEVLKTLPQSLTSLKCSSIVFTEPQRAVESLDTLHPFPKLKEFDLPCDFSGINRHELAAEDAIYTQLILLMPVVETFVLGLTYGCPTLGMHHLELFNKATLRTLKAELQLEEMAPIENLKSRLALLLPKTRVDCYSLENRLEELPTLDCQALDVSDVQDGFDWNSIKANKLPHLAKLVIAVERSRYVTSKSFTSLTDLTIEAWPRSQFGIDRLSGVCPPNLTRLILNIDHSPPSCFYPLSPTLTILECPNPLPLEVAKCTSLRELTFLNDPHQPHHHHDWSLSHLPPSLAYICFSPSIWEQLLNETPLASFCQRLPLLRRIHTDELLSEEMLNRFRRIPVHISVTEPYGRPTLSMAPSQLAALAGLSHGQVVLQPGESLNNCLSGSIAPRAYNIRPIFFSARTLSDEEIALFMPYLASSTTTMELDQLSALYTPLQWPPCLTKLVIQNHSAPSFPDDVCYFPATLKALIIRHKSRSYYPRFDQSLPKGLTRLELSEWEFDYVVQWPPALVSLTASFALHCIVENLETLPSSISHLSLCDGLLPYHFGSLPTTLKRLDCDVPSESLLIFADLVQSKGIIWTSHSLRARADHPLFNFEASLDDLVATTRQL